MNTELEENKLSYLCSLELLRIKTQNTEEYNEVK